MKLTTYQNVSFLKPSYLTDALTGILPVGRTRTWTRLQNWGFRTRASHLNGTTKTHIHVRVEHPILLTQTPIIGSAWFGPHIKHVVRRNFDLHQRNAEGNIFSLFIICEQWTLITPCLQCQELNFQLQQPIIWIFTQPTPQCHKSYSGLLQTLQYKGQNECNSNNANNLCRQQWLLETYEGSNAIMLLEQKLGKLMNKCNNSKQQLSHVSAYPRI